MNDIDDKLLDACVRYEYGEHFLEGDADLIANAFPEITDVNETVALALAQAVTSLRQQLADLRAELSVTQVKKEGLMSAYASCHANYKDEYRAGVLLREENARLIVRVRELERLNENRR